MVRIKLSHRLVYFTFYFFLLQTLCIKYLIFHFVFLVCRTNDPFRCRDPSKKCIDIDQTCDEIQDCDDGFDESEEDLGCLPKTKPPSPTTTSISDIVPTKSGPQTGEF